MAGSSSYTFHSHAMQLSTDNILLIGSILLIISLIAGKTSFKFGVPTLILFLTIGILAGSEGLGGIEFDSPGIAQFIGIVALNVILFSGGLETSWTTIKPVLWQGISLSTIGVLITAFTMGGFICLVTELSFFEGLLLGSIISSTDAAAVFSILRSKNLSLKDNIRPTLELESGSNDPMAYVLTISSLTLITQPETTFWSIVGLFASQMIVGAVAGVAFGWASTWLINKIHLGLDALYPLLVIALMFLTYTTTGLLHGNGFLAVYLCGLFLGNNELIHKNSIIRSFDGLAWLMQIILFLTLGLLVFPSQVVPIIGVGLLIAIFQIFIARPVSVMFALSFFKMKNAKRAYISWVGLRGAVPIVFATYPLISGLDNASLIFNIVFFISAISVLLQGSSLPMMAKVLNVALPQEQKKITPIDQLFNEQNKSVKKEITITENSIMAHKKIVDLKLPESVWISLIERDSQFITPKGDTEIHPNDRILLLAEKRADLQRFEEQFCF